MIEKMEESNPLIRLMKKFQKGTRPVTHMGPFMNASQTVRDLQHRCFALLEDRCLPKPGRIKPSKGWEAFYLINSELWDIV